MYENAAQWIDVLEIHNNVERSGRKVMEYSRRAVGGQTAPERSCMVLPVSLTR